MSKGTIEYKDLENSGKFKMQMIKKSGGATSY